MSKVVKIAAWAVGAIVALFLIVVIVVAVTFDPNDYKPTIVEKVKEATGRDLVIQGDIGLSLFPWIGAEVGKVSLGNAPGFGDEPFAAVDSAGVKLKLLPLLTRSVKLDTLVLHGLRLNLTTKKDGTTNWQDMAGGEGAPAEGGTEGGGTSAAPVAALAIGGLDVRDAQVVWDDRQAGARYRISDLALRSGAIEPGEPTDVSMNFDLESNAPEMTGKVTLETVVTVDAGAARYRLGDMDFTVDATGSGLPGGKLDASLKADVDADLKAQTLQLGDLEAVLAGLTLKGSVNGTKILDAPQISGELSVPEFTPRAVMQKLDVAVDTADAKALSSASATLRFAATQDSVSVEDMKAKLDDSTLDVSAKVSHFAQPVIRFALGLDAIDLDRYLAPTAQATPSAAPASAPASGSAPSTGAAAPRSAPSPGAAASAGASGLPVEMLRTLDVDGTIKVGSLKVANLTVRSFDAVVKGKGGVVAMHPASASLYGGTYAGNVGLDARAQHGGALVVSVDERLEGVQAGPLVKDLTGKESVAGTGNVTAKLTTRSTTGEDFVEHLNGDVTLSLRDGAVKGVNVAGIIRSAYAKFKGQTAPAQSGPNETDFTSLDGKFRFVNGVLHDDLNAQSPLLRIDGKGQVDLVREQIDYVVTANIVGSLEGQGGKTLDELNAVPLPIRVKGALTDPGFSLDIAEVMKGKTKQEVKKRVDKETEKLKEKLGDDLGDKLKGLFK